MARAKSSDQARIKSKTIAVDDINRGIEKLKDLMAQIEDLSREGFPYRDAVRARTELSLRETIRRIFGEKSEQYQNHKSHKLRTGHRAESAQTTVVLKQLVAQLEQQKLDLLSAKSGGAESAPPVQRSPDKPLLTAIPPSSQEPITMAAVPLASETTFPMTLSDTPTTNLGAPRGVPSTASRAMRSETIAHQATPLAEPEPAAGHDPIRSEPPSPDCMARPPDSESATATQLAGAPVPMGSPGGFSASAPATVTSPALYRTDGTAAAILPTEPSTPLSHSDASSGGAASSPVATGTADTAQATLSIVPSSGFLPASQQAQSGRDQSIGFPSETGPTLHEPVATPGPSEVLQPTPVPQRDSHAIKPLSPTDPITPGQQVPYSEGRSFSSSTLTHGLYDLPVHHDDPLAALRKICCRFHLVARQLRLRRDYRATLEVEDEYDVQDLLYALLRLEFGEVGSEDWCPSYGAGATRTSYLLHTERMVVVAKKTKTGVTARELMEQVRIDSTHYSGRADCRTLMCFIYDPEGRVGNPRGLESDLTMVSDTFTLEVIIAPK